MELQYKDNGLVPAVIQNAATLQVLMVGYMNEEAYVKTKAEQRVTFFSRSKQRLWTKGETSGNFLEVVNILEDCDQDSLLIKVHPKGPSCHKGTENCFDDNSVHGFLYELEQTIAKRVEEGDESSYTVSLFKKGMNKIIQKFGEEAIELVIEAKDDNDILFKNEAADLFYHLLVMFNAKNMKIADIEKILRERAK
ncbi:MAG: phosphoribosyl-ATP pyrophosphohydrolase/phosphoribosyl-AMP cyclohydrolase [Planctomycetota bacterium]|jgi:phosphoribosyl-ATP pyrophosphohydrolase/phosphoribosyl-AMP cyclohydrolase|uniref:bifunctional phosphoribosyl-AMP cyclohydrolase/phosphoribosyl-ATP diphosphatase HisIE n=1 Tax=Patiriisocius sp. Uisw_047 TaxID=3230969 RepID=UPI0039EC1EF3